MCAKEKTGSLNGTIPSQSPQPARNPKPMDSDLPVVAAQRPSAPKSDITVAVLLDLTDLFPPFCFLKLKSELYQMTVGAVMEVIMADPEAVDDLLRIVGRSTDRIEQVVRESDITRIFIRKGAPHP
jgi:TusA-related sulfurtransferase